jgi:hypothetical protein
MLVAAQRLLPACFQNVRLNLSLFHTCGVLRRMMHVHKNLQFFDATPFAAAAAQRLDDTLKKRNLPIECTLVCSWRPSGWPIQGHC